jgi:hypothetical protein
LSIAVNELSAATETVLTILNAVEFLYKSTVMSDALTPSMFAIIKQLILYTLPLLEPFSTIAVAAVVID